MNVMSSFEMLFLYDTPYCFCSLKLAAGSVQRQHSFAGRSLRRVGLTYLPSGSAEGTDAAMALLLAVGMTQIRPKRLEASYVRPRCAATELLQYLGRCCRRLCPVQAERRLPLKIVIGVPCRRGSRASSAHGRGAFCSKVALPVSSRAQSIFLVALKFGGRKIAGPQGGTTHRP